MASLEIQKGRYRIVFRYGGEKFQRALDTDSKKKAVAAKMRVEENLELLRRGRLAYDPQRDDLATLLLSDGQLNTPHRALSLIEPLDTAIRRLEAEIEDAARGIFPVELAVLQSTPGVGQVRWRLPERDPAIHSSCDAVQFQRPKITS
ncbi:MAG TPA: hypothetical protein VKE94_17590 [Gemmataceae bacterium]|nr:hypothetical protein [Gemmataceae bacterium]